MRCPITLSIALMLAISAEAWAAETASMPFTLADAEATALASHPAIEEAAARVRAARGNCLQVGLPPNPTVGYLGSEIGNDGKAGQQGIYVGQQFIRGNKLGLNRQVASQQVRELEQQWAAEQLRVLAAVRIAFYEVYLAQREIELAQQLVGIGKTATQSVEGLLEAKEARRIDVLQSEIELQRIEVKSRQAQVKRDAAWRQLAAAIGQPDHPLQYVVADESALAWSHDWQTSLQMLLDGSPQLAALTIDVARARAALARACAEPIPNVNAQVSVQYDDSTDYTVTGVQVGMPIPLWNRNQGGIAEARYELAAAKHRLEKMELELTAELAKRFRQFEASQAQASAYQDGIMSRAKQNLDLTRQAYEAGEASYLDLLTVQRTYFESNLDYIDTLRMVNQSVQMLTGYLLGPSAN